MKNTTLKIFAAFLVFNFQLSNITAQISINKDGNSPDASAMLDVSSTNKGVLIPRMDSTARTNISSPAEGLMVFDSTTNTFWYYDLEWIEIRTSSQLLNAEDLDITYADFDLLCLELIGTLALGSLPVSIAADEDYVYVVDFLSQDLRVIDVSDKTKPTLTGQLSIGSSPNSVFVDGDYLYIVDSDNDDLTIIDVSTKSNPTLVTSFALGAYPRSVFVADNIAYVVDSNSDDLKVIDVSDKSSPVQLSSIVIGNIPQEVVVVGNYAYIIDSGSDDLKIINVSDKTTPVQISNLGIGGTPKDISVKGDYAYIVDNNSDDLKIIDISNKNTPTQTASLSIGNTPISVNVFGDYVAVTENSSEKLYIVEVSDVSNPTIIGSEDIGSVTTAATLFDNFSYVADESSVGLQVIRLACNQNLVIDPISLAIEAQPTIWIEKDDGTTYTNRQVGISVSSPTSELEVNGTVTATAFTGDGSNLTNLTGDNLGNHTATQTLDLSNNNISNGGTINASAFVGDGSSLTNLPNQVPIGTIQMWPTSYAPTGWLICDGTTFDASTYPDLNTLLGGNTLPDFVGRFPLGVGNSIEPGGANHSLGETGGAETHTLSINEMPSHSHGINYSGKSKSGSGGEVSDLEASSSNISTDATGGGQPHNNMPPYYTINFIIKAQ